MRINKFLHALGEVRGEKKDDGRGEGRGKEEGKEERKVREEGKRKVREEGRRGHEEVLCCVGAMEGQHLLACCRKEKHLDG